MKYFDMHNILSDAQHGFVEGRSTLTNLLESLNDWTLSLEIGDNTVVIYIDFSKAFDTVIHSKLLYRFKSYGISGCLLSWLSEYLSNRTHQTRVGSALSESAEMLSGTNQGSVIGPLCFLTYINELIQILRKCGVTVKMFADDVKLYATFGNNAETGCVQKALDHLVRWAEAWQLTISIKNVPY